MKAMSLKAKEGSGGGHGRRRRRKEADGGDYSFKVIAIEKKLLFLNLVTARESWWRVREVSEPVASKALHVGVWSTPDSSRWS